MERLQNDNNSKMHTMNNKIVQLEDMVTMLVNTIQNLTKVQNTIYTTNASNSLTGSKEINNENFDSFGNNSRSNLATYTNPRNENHLLNNTSANSRQENAQSGTNVWQDILDQLKVN